MANEKKVSNKEQKTHHLHIVVNGKNYTSVSVGRTSPPK